MSNFIPYLTDAEDLARNADPESQTSMGMGLVMLGLNLGNGLTRVYGHIHSAPVNETDPVGILVVQQKKERGRRVEEIEYFDAEVPLWIAQEALVMFRFANRWEVWA